MLKQKKVLLVGSMSSMLANFNIGNIMILKKLGYEVHVAANFGKEDPVSVQKKQKFRSFLVEKEINSFNLPFPRGIGKIFQDINLLKKLDKIMKVNQYDFIHTNSPLASVLVRIVANRNKVPVIYTVHGFQFFSGGRLRDWLLFYPVERLLAKLTDTIITINKEDYQRARKMGFNRVRLIPGVGISSESFQDTSSVENKKQDGSFVLTTVGELNNNKNQLCVLRAIKDSVLRNKIHYIICGIGKNLELYQDYVKENGLESNVTFAGYQNDISRVLAKTDVFVFPSFREGLSVAVMEAMAAGKPVFASKIRGNVDLIDEYQGGLFFDPADFKSLTYLFDNYLDNLSLLTKMGTYNQIKVHDYTKDVVNRKMEDIYKDVIKRIETSSSFYVRNSGGSNE